MADDTGAFAVKLQEMGTQYGKLLGKIKLCESGSPKLIRGELKKTMEEYEEKSLSLEEKMAHSRCRAASSLFEAQKEYWDKAGRILRQQLAKNPHRENKKSISDPVPEDKSVADPKEALSLYAEFAMDFATLSVQQALMAALNALDIQEHLPTKEEHL